MSEEYTDGPLHELESMNLALASENTKLKAQLAMCIDLLAKLNEETKVFLAVSQKIHFPEAREISAKVDETLAKLSGAKDEAT